jgi:hypothetical protein
MQHSQGPTTRYRRVQLLRALAFSLLIWTPANLLVAQMTGDPELLKSLSSACADQSARIVTWSGKAEILDSDLNSDDQRVLRERRAIASFTYSNDGDQLHFDQLVQVQEDAGVKKFYRHAGIRTRNEFYRYGPVEVLGTARVAVRPFQINSQNRSFRADDFDPFIFNKVETGKRTVQEFAEFYYNSRESREVFPTSVTKERSLVVVKVTSRVNDPNAITWTFHFDLDQGGLPVYVKGGSDSGDDTQSEWRNSFVAVDGTWLPEKLVYRLTDGRSRRIQSRVTTFTEQQVNVRLKEDEFDVSSLPLQSGDKVLVDATGAWERVGLIKPPSVQPTEMPPVADERTSLTRFLFIGNLVLIIILCAVFLGRRLFRAVGHR